ncbi:MAG: pantoate--beta-alanine ligase, partial [Nitrospirae bacterium]|nr:pantoate--beta-alanine ligase [Nitrospirota bacterium]
TEIQYASAYDPDTLDEIDGDDRVGGGPPRSVLIAVALKLGTTRLIDNILVEL